MASVVLLAKAVAAHADVVFPTPGVMRVTDLPSAVRAGAALTLREAVPDAILGGEVLLQRESSSGAWRTVASAPLRPWVFWLHWHVPPQAPGSSIQVRFLLRDRAELLAASPDYRIHLT